MHLYLPCGPFNPSRGGPLELPLSLRSDAGSAGISKQKALGCGRFSFCGRSTRCSCPAGPLIHRGVFPSSSPCRFASMPSGAGISRQWPWIAGVLSFAAVLPGVRAPCISSQLLDPYARFRPFLLISSHFLDPYARWALSCG